MVVRGLVGIGHQGLSRFSGECKELSLPWVVTEILEELVRYHGFQGVTEI